MEVLPRDLGDPVCDRLAAAFLLCLLAGADLVAQDPVEQARRLLEPYLQQDPGNAHAWYLHGVAAAELGDAATARNSLEKAVRLDPRLFPAYTALADACVAAGDRQAAIRVLEQGLDQFPGDDLLLFRLGRLYLDAGDSDRALSFLRRVAPPRAPAGYWETRGRAEMQAGQLEAALDAFRRALDERPESVRLLQVLSGLALKLGETEESWDYIAKARALAPDSPKVVYAFGVVSLENGLVAEAINAFRLLLLREPDKPDYLMMLGNAVLESPTEYSKAPDYFRRYVELRPEDPVGHLMLGYSLYATRQYDVAAAELEKTLQMQPDSPEALYYLGMIAFDRNRDDEAIGYLQRVLADSDRHMKAHLALGRIWLRRGKFADAVAELEKALELSGGTADIHYNLSRAYAQLGDRAKAAEHLKHYQEFKKLEEERELRSRELRFLERYRPGTSD
ncbi:MAG: hypothetical protein Kow00109_28410 [Acidobacteriota bacterium]